MSRPWQWAVRSFSRRWVRVAIKPADAAAAIAPIAPAVCYVLESDSQADLAALHYACRELGLPAPAQHFELSGTRRLFGRRTVRRAPRQLEQLVALASRGSAADVQLVPVAVFWGRARHKEVGPWRALFTEDRVLVGGFKKLLNVLVSGRNTLVYFGDPLALREAMAEGLDGPRNVRRILRTLRTTLRAQRASTVGPDLSHRRTLVATILNSQAVRAAVRAGPLPRRDGLRQARKHALEIAANYSQPFINFMSLSLGRLWNWLYDGVEVRHAGNLEQIAAGAEIIYVPCHRSHMDYLLLSYVIYHQGFAVPHVAAGVNLNMPVIGRFLRKGGAFFLRRSFKGDPLYGVVFAKYLGFMMARGHPLEYFVEGGRSRTGRLLTPRTGMLSMTVRSFVRDPKRPVVFMPVYFGYERVAEGRTYVGELSGKPKQKESVAGLVRAAFGVLRAKYGKVHVNLGEPILLEALLEKHNPQWRSAPAEDGRPASPWMSATIEELALTIVKGINAAAAVTPVNLVAMAMLATPRQALPENELVSQLDLYRRLLSAAPYAPLVTVTAESGSSMMRYTETMSMLERQAHPLGDILRMTVPQAVLATYFRNNVLHLFAMPSLLACGFIGNARLATAELKRLVHRVYPYIAAELFLRWEESQIDAVVEALLDTFAQLGLLETDAQRGEWRRPPPTSADAMRLSLLAQATLQTLERYYLAIALLLQAGPGTITQAALEERCHLSAQRMSVLYGLNSPEFFDKSLFHNFLDLLGRRSVVQAAEDGTLSFGDALHEVARDAQTVLSEQIRHSILQVTLAR